MKKKKYIVGIDGGGTKTACMMVNLEDDSTACCVTGGSNHQIVGLSGTKDSISRAIDLACSELNATREEIAFVFLGMAGADFPDDFALLRSGLREVFGDIPFEVVNDIWIVFSSTAQTDWGAVSICGTGSNLVVKTPQGVVHSVRALRYRLGNYGGGNHLTNIALHHAFRCDEGTGAYTRLAEELPILCNTKDMDELAAKIYTSNYRYSYSFNIAKLVFDLAAQGDTVCLKIIREMGSELGEMLGRLIVRADLADQTVPVVLAGSQYAKDKHRLLIDPFCVALTQFAPHTVVKLAENPPVLGAVINAASAVGLPLSARSRELLCATARSAFS